MTLVISGTGGTDRLAKASYITVLASLYLPLVQRRGEAQTYSPALSLKGEGAETAYSAVSGADGTYTISGLPPGVYQVTPFLSGKYLSPGSRLLNLPPGASGQDFTCVDCGEPTADGMVTVYAGNFQMGCSPDDNNCFIDESPRHTVYLDSYDIDQYEVTNARYKACVDGGGCSVPHDTSSWTRPSYFYNPTYANFPVENLDWGQAYTFCAWEGKRLPTEAEWEKAARGSADTRIFPWGNQPPDCSLGNVQNFHTLTRCSADTSAVGSYPAGASPYGALDMVGNVDEWVGDWYEEAYYSSQETWQNPTGPNTSPGYGRVTRSGGLGMNWYDTRVSTRFALDPGQWFNEGFRCVRPR